MIELLHVKRFILIIQMKQIIFLIICRTRSRIHRAVRGKLKWNSTKAILGMNIDTYRKWIEFQFTPEMNWSNIEIDQVKPICIFAISIDEELWEAFCWKGTQPLLKQGHQNKGTNIIF